MVKGSSGRDDAYTTLSMAVTVPGVSTPRCRLERLLRPVLSPGVVQPVTLLGLDDVLCLDVLCLPTVVAFASNPGGVLRPRWMFSIAQVSMEC